MVWNICELALILDKLIVDAGKSDEMEYSNQWLQTFTFTDESILTMNDVGAWVHINII